MDHKITSTGDSCEIRVSDLLTRMTLEEKVGQMTQLTVEAVSSQPRTAHSRLVIDQDKLREAILENHVGSIINVFTHAMYSHEWIELIDQIQTVAVNESRLGIPVLYGIDGVHGANYSLDATLFPQNINLAATWDVDIARRVGLATARDLGSCSIPWDFAPVLDLGRHPMWSRFFETFGEDSEVAAAMGSAMIEGLQDPIFGVAACAKHFIGYGQAKSGRDRTPTSLTQRELLDLYLYPFECAVRAGVKTMMINSGEINGVPCHADPRVLTELLRDRLGFEGVIVSDWEDVIKLHTIHRVASDEKEATAMAVLAGLDMSMTPFSGQFATHLVELVREGRIAEERIDRSVERVLRLKYQLNLWPAGSAPGDQHRSDESSRSSAETIRHNGSAYSENGRPSVRADALSREAASKSMVLLENRGGFLPLSTDMRIAVTGPAAVSNGRVHGAWTYTWQGNDEEIFSDSTPLVGAVLEQRFRSIPVEDVVSVEDSDAIVVCLGEESSVEKPGDIGDLRIDSPQRRCVEEALQTGVPVILVLYGGRPRLLGTIPDRVTAVIWAGLPGPFSGEALADLLDGSINPSGRLPFTYPREGEVLLTYDHKHSDEVGRDYGIGQTHKMNGFNPQWEFGAGQSYTSFTYERLSIRVNDAVGSRRVDVSVTVKNGGERRGRETVLLFVSDDFASVTPSVQRLRGFQTVELDSGQFSRVEFSVPEHRFFVCNDEGIPVLEEGSFTVSIGSESGTFVL